MGRGDLAGRRALVTGPAKGMGAAISRALAEEGADLVLAARDTDAVGDVAEEVRAMGRRADIVACDITDPASVNEARDAALAAASVHILVNVAGGRGPFGKSGIDTTPEEFDEIMRLNVDGAFLITRAFAPGMVAAGYGRIVHIGGTFGHRGRAGRLAYSASKWGLRGLVKSFALELGPSGIAVNCVSPGMVEGPRFDAVCADMADRLGISVEDAARHYAEDYALRRLSTAEDVADAVVFLASDRARQVTGQDLVVDGGWAM